MTMAQAKAQRSERETVRDIAAVYETARQQLLDELTALYERLGSDPTPSQIRRLANDAGLYLSIRRRLAQLEADFVELIADGISDVATVMGESVLQEIGVLAAGLGVEIYPFVANELLDLAIAPAIEQVPGVVSSLQSTFINELRTGLAQGEKFSRLSVRLLSKDPAKLSIFNRGLTSAKLMTRRAVNQAGNNARLMFLQESVEQVPGMQKQVIATIDSRTTRLSLQMHGAIQDVDKPFQMKSGPPAPFDRRMMAPPFHWNDRDTIVGYHKNYEERSSLKTADMLAEAKKALADRDS